MGSAVAGSSTTEADAPLHQSSIPLRREILLKYETGVTRVTSMVTSLTNRATAWLESGPFDGCDNKPAVYNARLGVD